MEAAYVTPPANRTEMLARLRAYYLCRLRHAGPELTSPTSQRSPEKLLVNEMTGSLLNAATDSGLEQLVGHYFYEHLGCSWSPTAIVQAVVGENINSINAHLAFTRGAARQFGISWEVDFSAWMQGNFLDYSIQQFWSGGSCPTCGHSLSLFLRTYYASYYAGASGVIAEAGAVNWFGPVHSGDTILPLSPLGLIGQEFYRVTHSDMKPRPIPYIPFAILLEEQRTYD